MASPRPKRESFDFDMSSAQEVGSASSSQSPPGGVFGLSPPDSSPRDSRKRRKDRPSWVKHTFTPHFDGHLWRKYGQKNIKDSAFPRLYYRCSYREDKQCLASKLVQQENSDDPPLYKVTYTYEHTCNTTPVPTPEILADQPAAPTSNNAFFLNFHSTGNQRDAHQMEQQRPYLPTAPGRPFLMLSFDDSNSQHDEQQAAFPSELPPAASSGFMALPAPPPPTTGQGDRFSTWDSFRYDLDEHSYLPENGNNW